MKISVLTPSIRPAGLEVTQRCLQEQTFTDFEWLVEIGLPSEGHDLNAAYNRMLRRAKGELIVSLQDFIRVKPDYLERWYNAHLKHPRAFMTAPVGKVDNLSFEPPAKWDWRAFKETNMKWNCWEIDSGAAPLSALKEIGGFDETLDEFWSSDNVNVGSRAEIAGYEFLNLFDNPAIAYDHDAFMTHPYRKFYNPSHNTARMEAFRAGLKIDYLS